MNLLAKEYSLSKLSESSEAIKAAPSWSPVRDWLLQNGLIFTQPMTRTTSFARKVNQPQARDAAQLAIGDAADEHGFKVADVPTDASERIVERSRSDINAGAVPFETSKIVLQEFAFDQRIRPHLVLRRGFLESSGLANTVGIGERQLHHLITVSMVAALVLSQPQIPAQALRDSPRYQYWASPGGHIGYERWHRMYDAHMIAYISSFPPGQLTPMELITEIHNWYQSDHGDGVTRRIPGVSLI